MRHGTAMRLAEAETWMQWALALADALETTLLHRVAGLTGERTAVVTTRPFRTPPPHHLGRGADPWGHMLMPGEVSLAHHGVLVLDALPECRRHVLEVWRQPLEEGVL